MTVIHGSTITMILETDRQHELEKPGPVRAYSDEYFKGNIFVLTFLRVLCVSDPESLVSFGCLDSLS